MHINNINNINDSYARKTTFGYKFPQEADLRNYASRILKEEGEVAYNEYLGAVQHFIQKRFDATELIDKYLPKIKKFGCQILPWECNSYIESEYDPFSEFQHLCDNLEFPKIKTKTKTLETVTNEIPKKPSLIDKLLMRKPKTEQITETREREIEIETDDYDFKNINPELCLVPAEYGPHFFDKIYIFTEDIRYQYEDTYRAPDYLKENHKPVYYNEDYHANPFASKAGIEYMEKEVDKYLKRTIESGLQKIISKAKKNRKIIKKYCDDAAGERRVHRDFDSLGI